jgi:hypothetical protein
MPIVTSSSTIRVSAEHLSLSLNICHEILVGTSAGSKVHLRTRFPEEVDVEIGHQFHLSIRGKVNKKKVVPETLLRSAVLTHLTAYLRENMDGLGLSDVSDAYVGNEADVKGTVLP